MVVLPAPLGPSSPKISPARTSRSSRSTARMSPGYTFVSCSVRITTSSIAANLPPARDPGPGSSPNVVRHARSRPHHRQRHRLRLPRGRAGRRSARAVPPRLPRPRAHVGAAAAPSSPPRATTRSRRGCAATPPRRSRPTATTRWRRSRSTRSASPTRSRGDARRGAHRPRLGRDRVLHRGRAPARPVPPARDARRAPHRRAGRGVPVAGAAPALLLHVRVPDPARRDGRAERRLRLHRLPVELLVARLHARSRRSCAR